MTQLLQYIIWLYEESWLEIWSFLFLKDNPQSKGLFVTIQYSIFLWFIESVCCSFLFEILHFFFEKNNKFYYLKNEYFSLTFSSLVKSVHSWVHNWRRIHRKKGSKLIDFLSLENYEEIWEKLFCCDVWRKLFMCIMLFLLSKVSLLKKDRKRKLKRILLRNILDLKGFLKKANFYQFHCSSIQ